MTDLTRGSATGAMLEGFLDANRAVAEHKLDGLTLGDATKVAMPSGTTMLGIVKHLGWAERRWFRHFFLGEPPEPMGLDASFVPEPADTVESIVAQYRDDCAGSRRIIEAAPSLDAMAAVEHRRYGAVTLEWILVHLIEETARHAGHLDILRELTDGRTGD